MEEIKGDREDFEIRKECFGRKTLLWSVIVKPKIRPTYIKLRAYVG